MTPAVVILILAAVVRLGNAQTTQTVATTTMIVQGANVPIASLLQQSSISTVFYQYWAAAQMQNALTSGVTYTLFVPTNAAWNNLSSTDQATISACLSGSCGTNLQTLMKYHMWIGSSTTSTFSTGANGVCQSTFGPDTSTYQCLTWATQISGAQTHVAVTQAGGAWYVNGAKIVLADQLASNFVVQFVNKWLYPIDTATTAQAYLQTASVSPTTGLITQSCSMCSTVFSSLWATAASGALPSFYTWAQSTAGSQTGAVTMFVPYAQPLSSQYSINTLASMIQAMSASGNLTSLATIAAVHVIPNHVLFLAPWIANGAGVYGCGPANLQTMNQYVQSCDLTLFSPGVWAIEVGKTSAVILYPDIPVENGVVHIVSTVLNYVYGNLWNVVQIHPLLTHFEAYLQSDSTGIALGMLQNPNSQYTVFAPADSAWTSTVTNAVQTNASLLSSVLQLGIVQTSIVYGTLVSQITTASPVVLTTAGVAGNRLRVSMNLNGTEVDGGPSNGFQTSTIVAADLGATNGILHIVSGNVFGVPQLTIAQFILSRYDLTMSAMYLGQMAQAWGLLSNTGTYTVWVPNNAAWNQLNSNSQLSLITRTYPGQVIPLDNLLLRHYVAGNAQLYNSPQMTTSGSSYSMQTLNGLVTFTTTSIASGSTPPQYAISYQSTVTASVVVSDIVCTNGRVHIISSVLAVPADVQNMNSGYSCQNPATCSSTAVFANVTLLLLGVMLGLIGRRV